MDPTTFQFLGILAMLASVAAFRRIIDARVASLFAAFTWIIWGIHARDITQMGNGSTVQHSYTSLTFMGLAAALVMLILLFKVTLGELDPKERR